MAHAGDSRSFEDALERLCDEVDRACAEAEDWPHGVAAAIRATLELGATEPETMRALTVDVFDDGAAGAVRYRGLVELFAARMADGRAHCPDGGESLPAVIEEALIGALAHPIAAAARMGGEGQLPALAPGLIQFALSPYVGAEEARRLAGPAS